MKKKLIIILAINIVFYTCCINATTIDTKDIVERYKTPSGRIKVLPKSCKISKRNKAKRTQKAFDAAWKAYQAQRQEQRTRQIVAFELQEAASRRELARQEYGDRKFLELSLTADRPIANEIFCRS